MIQLRENVTFVGVHMNEFIEQLYEDKLQVIREKFRLKLISKEQAVKEKETAEKMKADVQQRIVNLLQDYDRFITEINKVYKGELD